MNCKLFCTAFLLIFSFQWINILAQNTLDVVNSNRTDIKYVIDNTEPKNWSLAPELKPDRLYVDCINTKTNVKFVTDIDSISYSIELKDTVQFYIINGVDTCLTEIVGVPKNVNFSDEYIRENKDKIFVEIPKVHELVNIMMSLTEVGQVDNNMTDMTTDYFNEVCAYFAPYKDHPAMTLMNELIHGPLENKYAPMDSYWNYYSLKMNACVYLFDENGNIISNGTIRKPGFDNVPNLVELHKEVFADFAEASNFMSFYKSHQSYYDESIKIYNELNPIADMKKWLEAKFGFSYGSYRIYFSPLVGGAHSTQHYEDNGFKQTFMFICRAYYSDKYNKAINEMSESRVVFTEIDHNFVNLISDKYLDEINEVMGDRKKWANDENQNAVAYSGPISVFNEYMTFALFSAYCYDRFEKSDVALFMKKMEKQMTEGRGFVKFKEFNQKLISIYLDNPKVEISQIYEELLSWCKEQ